jgi:hypothetical protein
LKISASTNLILHFQAVDEKLSLQNNSSTSICTIDLATPTG